MASLHLVPSALALASCLVPVPAQQSRPSQPPPRDLIASSVAALIAMQEEDGAWPYEGVYRVKREIPVGYRVGGTAIVAGTLLRAAPGDAKALAAVERGLEFVLANLADPLLEPSTANAYDVRIWGHCCALEFLCLVRERKANGKHAPEVDEHCKKLVATLVTEEIKGGGWNYADHRSHAPFVTAPVVQSLLWAKAQGEAVPDEVLERARDALLRSRFEDGAFAYSGTANPKNQRGINLVPGSISRSPVAETTLALLGTGDVERLRAAVHAFHAHWLEIALRSQQKGTHEGPYKIAPYFFYYGHRYLAQALELLPAAERERLRSMLLREILLMRDEDGTWNDRVFARSRAYGTSMVVLALLDAGLSTPPAWKAPQAPTTPSVQPSPEKGPEKK